jgi:phosphopantetheinyl transferase (holo-ACP synthase)
MFFAPLVYIYLFIVGKYQFGYRFKRLKAFRAKICYQLKDHKGPVIRAANHLTLVDSFLVFWAVFPWGKLYRDSLVPWSTPEYRNYYHIGGWFRSRLIRGILYLCRCIPFLREGEDAASIEWREKAFEKCVWILKNGGSVFVYPEAGRSRKGWLEPHRPKDFLGRLALAVPEAKFLCVYLRGEGQLCTTAYPAKGESFRAYGELIDGAAVETSPRQVSQKLFDALAQLQERWFKDSRLAKNCGGNDVVDLKNPLLLEHFDEGGEPDPVWLERHLTVKERSYLAGQTDRLKTVAKFLAAKEAAHKAFVQSGIFTPSGGFSMIEADLFLRRATHVPTGAQADVAFTDEDDDKVHCIAVLRGGYIGDEPSSGDVLWGIDEAPAGANPSDYVRERCLRLIAESNDEIGTPDVLSFTDVEGIPKVVRRGRVQDWGVSLSHSGRYVAYSFMVS